MSNKPRSMKNKKVKKQGSPSGLGQVINPQNVQDYPPERREQLETTLAAATQMMYDPKTKGDVQKMLQSTPPEQAIPMATNAIMDQFEGMAKRKSGSMPLDIKLATGVHIFNELVELSGNMGTIPLNLSDEQKQPMMRAAIQQYIQKGLKDKSIDPIELQREVEPLLNDKEMHAGSELAKMQGVPSELTQQQGMQGMLQKQAKPMQVENQSLKKQNQQMAGALQGVTNAPQEGEA